MDLADNDPTDTYTYLITIMTGSRRGSGTTANVTLTLKGNTDTNVIKNVICHIYLSTSNTFLYLKIGPKTGVRLILELRLNDQLKSLLVLKTMWDYHIWLLQW